MNDTMTKQRPILIFNDQLPKNESNYSCALLLSKPIRKLKIPYIIFDNFFKRSYRNFKVMPQELWESFKATMISLSFSYRVLLFLRDMFDYVNLKTSHRYITMTSREIYRSISYFIFELPMYYKFYSIACGILIPLFFLESGIPPDLSINDSYIKFVDFFDYLFLHIASFFVYKIYTDTYIIGDSILNRTPSEIAHMFLSFLLWNEIKPHLQLLYELFVKSGFRKEDIWIIL